MTNLSSEYYSDLSKSLTNYVDNLSKSFDPKALDQEFNTEVSGNLYSILQLLEQNKKQIDLEIKELTDNSKSNVPESNKPKILASKYEQIEIIQNITSNLQNLHDSNKKAENMFDITRITNEFKANMKQDLDKYNNPEKFFGQETSKIKSGFLSTIISFIGNYFQKPNNQTVSANKNVIIKLGEELRESIEQQSAKTVKKDRGAPPPARSKSKENIVDQQQERYVPRQDRGAPPAPRFTQNQTLTAAASPSMAQNTPSSSSSSSASDLPKTRSAPPIYPKELASLYSAVSTGDKDKISEKYDTVPKEFLTEDNLTKLAQAAKNNAQSTKIPEKTILETGLKHLKKIAKEKNGIELKDVSQARSR